MDVIETATETELGMMRGGIGTGRRRVGGSKPEIQIGSEDELSVGPLRGRSARDEDFVTLTLKSWTGSGSGSGAENGRGRGR